MSKSEPDVPFNDPRMVVAATFRSLVRHVFPRMVEDLLEEYRLARIALKKTDDASAADLLSHLSHFGAEIGDAQLRLFVLEQASPTEALTLWVACDWYLNRLVKMDPYSQEFRTECGNLLGQQTAIYVCLSGLEMMSEEEDREQNGEETRGSPE